MSPLSATLSRLPESQTSDIDGYLRFLKERKKEYTNRFDILDDVGKVGTNYRNSNVRSGLLEVLCVLDFLHLPWMLFWGWQKLKRGIHESNLSKFMGDLAKHNYSDNPKVFARNVEELEQAKWERAIYGVRLSNAVDPNQRRLEQQQREALIRRFCRIVSRASGRDFTSQEKQELFQLANAVEENDNLFASVTEWDFDGMTKTEIYGIKLILDKFSNSGIDDQGRRTGQGYVCSVEERKKLLKMADKLNNVGGCIDQATPEQLHQIKQLEDEIAKSSLIYDYQYAAARVAYLLNLQSRKWRLNARSQIKENFQQVGKNALITGTTIVVLMSSTFGLLSVVPAALLSLPLAAAYTAFQHWGARRYPGHRFFRRTAEARAKYLKDQTAVAEEFSEDLKTAVEEAKLAGQRLTKVGSLNPVEIRSIKNCIDGLGHLIAISTKSRHPNKMISQTDMGDKLNRLGLQMNRGWKRFLPLGGPPNIPFTAELRSRIR